LINGESVLATRRPGGRIARSTDQGGEVNWNGISAGLGVALALMLAPIITRWWKKVDDYDNRRMAAHEEKVARKKTEKAAQKAAKLAAKDPRYTSATVVGPPRIGFDGDRSPAEGAGEGKTEG